MFHFFGQRTEATERMMPKQCNCEHDDVERQARSTTRTLKDSLQLSDDEALALAEVDDDQLRELMARAAAIRDRRWGRTFTFSPKVFLPVTNLCRDRCEYCSFRRSPGEPGERTMSPADIDSSLGSATAAGCSEALLCLGDRPETAFPSYRRTLADFGHQRTVDYLVWVCRRALGFGLLPHTNAGVLNAAEMRLLKPVNASLGLMLETASPRLAGKGLA